MRIAYKFLKLNEPNKTVTVMSYLNTVLTHTKSVLILRESKHRIHVIIARQIALSRKMDQVAEFI